MCENYVKGVSPAGREIADMTLQRSLTSLKFYTDRALGAGGGVTLLRSYPKPVLPPS